MVAFSKVIHCDYVKPQVKFISSCFGLLGLNAKWLTMLNDGNTNNKNIVTKLMVAFSKVIHCDYVKPQVESISSCFELPSLNAKWLTMLNDGNTNNKNIVNYK